MMRRVVLGREAPLVAALVFVVVGSALREPRFLSWENFKSVLLWIPLLSVVALGQTCVMLTRGIDVSVGSTLGFSGMLAALFLVGRNDGALPAALGIAVGAGALVGAVNGSLVAFGRIPPIVVTLATLGIGRGLTFLSSGGRQVDEYQLPRALAKLSIDGPLGVPWVGFVALLATVAAHLYLTRSRSGRDLFALGGNPDAAALRGIPTNRVLFFVYVLCGAGAGLAGFLYVSRFGTVNPASVGSGFELIVIAAAAIGGTSVFGGAGSASGTLLGCLLLGTINVALAVLRFPDTWQSAIYGTVLLLAILFDDDAQRRLRAAATERRARQLEQSR